MDSKAGSFEAVASKDSRRPEPQETTSLNERPLKHAFLEATMEARANPSIGVDGVGSVLVRRRMD